jgi:hypothetical protein
MLRVVKLLSQGDSANKWRRWDWVQIICSFPLLHYSISYCIVHSKKQTRAKCIRLQRHFTHSHLIPGVHIHTYICTEIPILSATFVMNTSTHVLHSQIYVTQALHIPCALCSQHTPTPHPSIVNTTHIRIMPRNLHTSQKFTYTHSCTRRIGKFFCLSSSPWKLAPWGMNKASSGY